MERNEENREKPKLSINNMSSHSIVSNEEIKLLELNNQLPISSQEYTYRVIFLGEKMSGKTSMINLICGDKVSKKYCPTLCCDSRSKRFKINGRIVKIKFFDLGEVDLSYNMSAIGEYLKIVHAVIYVCDINRPASLNPIEKISSTFSNNSPFLTYLLMNKIDADKKEGKLDSKNKRVVNLINSTKLNLFETSINEKATVDIFFNTLLENLIEYYDKEENKMKYEQINTSDNTNIYFKFKPLKVKKRCYHC